MIENRISEGDKKFLVKMMRTFNIGALELERSSSRKKWPDIWITKGKVPRITVTQEWAKQGIDERRKRLVHEFLHLAGMEHNEAIGYSTHPSKDTLSMEVYKGLRRKK